MLFLHPRSFCSLSLLGGLAGRELCACPPPDPLAPPGSQLQPAPQGPKGPAGGLAA